MKCPACGKNMVEKDFGAVKVDVCEAGCNGIWFDWFELTKLDEQNEGSGCNIRESLLKEQVIPKRGDTSINCPKCCIPMHIHKYQSSKKVNVDECYACGGFFLDAGELAAIRETYMTDDEEAAYINSLIEEMPEFAKAKNDLEKNKTRIKAIKGLTKYLRLTK